jgi:hypothetical protein
MRGIFKKYTQLQNESRYSRKIKKWILHELGQHKSFLLAVNLIEGASVTLRSIIVTLKSSGLEREARAREQQTRTELKSSSSDQRTHRR